MKIKYSELYKDVMEFHKNALLSPNKSWEELTDEMVQIAKKYANMKFAKNLLTSVYAELTRTRGDKRK